MICECGHDIIYHYIRSGEEGQWRCSKCGDLRCRVFEVKE